MDVLSTGGIVNQALNSLGLDSIFFLGDNRYFRTTAIWSDIWKNFGYGAIVYLAAILGIDTELYEAARIDGAGRWQQTWHVTLPGMRMIIVLMLVMSLGNVLNAGFDQIFNLYSPAVYESGDIIDTFVYRMGVIDAQYGPATAVGMFKSVVSTIFISVSYSWHISLRITAFSKEDGMQKKTVSRIVFEIINYCIMFLLTAVCLLPVIHVLALSFSSNTAAAAGLVKLLPVEFTTYSYQYVAGRKEFWNAVLRSLQRVGIGVPLSMLLTILIAYPLSKEADRFRFRTVYVWLFFFTMLFSGGLIPGYILIQNLKMMDSIWALILPIAVSVYNVVLMLNFFRGIPRELEEAAQIDGAGHLQTCFRIYVPCALPSIATISLFTFVGHWNSWFDGLLFSNFSQNYPLASYLQTVVVKRDMALIGAGDLQAPPEHFRQDCQMRPDFHGHAARAGGISVRAEIFREGNRGWLREGVRIE